MDTFTPQEFDDDLFFDVVDEVDVLCESSANTLIMLGNDPHNKKLLDQLFRSVHTIKGDIALAHITPLLPILTAVEDILGMMRERRIQHNELISDLLLNIFEQVNGFIDDCAKLGYAQYHSQAFDNASRLISGIHPDNIQQHPSLLTQTLRVLEAPITTQMENEPSIHDFTDLRIDWEKELEPDLVFFHGLMKPVEERIDNWQGRSNRQLKLALLLNQYAKNSVDEQQLRAAVYLHDIGMTLLPFSLLQQSTPLLQGEILRVRSHVQMAVNILNQMPQWSEAMRFIHEHHERVDGQGYPNGLTNNDISDGAKILAIVDAFEAMTHERAQQVHQKRPIMHALQEIKSASGTQFCPYWVNILTKVMASIISK